MGISTCSYPEVITMNDNLHDPLQVTVMLTNYFLWIFSKSKLEFINKVIYLEHRLLLRKTFLSSLTSDRILSTILLLVPASAFSDVAACK